MQQILLCHRRISISKSNRIVAHSILVGLYIAGRQWWVHWRTHSDTTNTYSFVQEPTGKPWWFCSAKRARRQNYYMFGFDCKFIRHSGSGAPALDKNLIMSNGICKNRERYENKISFTIIEIIFNLNITLAQMKLPSTLTRKHKKAWRFRTQCVHSFILTINFIIFLVKNEL